MKKYLRRFNLESAYLADKDVDKELELKGATAEDVVSVTSNHYQTYTIWYRSKKR